VKWGSGTYLIAMLTTFERAFGLSATELAGLKSIGATTYSVVMVFVMVFAKKFHVPKTIGIATLGIGIAFLIQAIPYFYGKGRGTGPSSVSSSSLASSSSSSFGSSSNISDAFWDDYDQRRPLCFDQEKQKMILERKCSVKVEEEEEEAKRGQSVRQMTPEYVLLAIGKVCSMALVPFVVILYSPYIDDNVSHGQSATYISVVRSASEIGPVFGMGLGAYLSQIPVDSSYSDLSPADPQFIGAWWIGVMVFSPLLIIASVPMFFFPRNPRDGAESGLKMLEGQEKVNWTRSATKRDESEAYCVSWFKSVFFYLKDFLLDIWGVVSNKLWLCCFMGDMFNAFGWGGVFLFLPKTMEVQYRFPSWQANIILGSVLAAAGGLGMLFSGVTVRKWNLKPPAMGLHVAVVKFMYATCLIIMLFLTCKEAHIEGSDSSISATLRNLTTECNSGCGCDQDAFYPVCGEDNKNYFSPCHAGCTMKSSDASNPRDFVFHNCSCVTAGTKTAKNGFCPEKPCTMGYVYILFLFLWFFIAHANSMSGVLLKFRALKPEQKPLSVGIESLSKSLLAMVCSSMAYGALIDTSCRIWKESCGTTQNCYFYDMPKYHLIVHLGCAIFVYASSFIYAGSYFIAKKKNWDHLDEKDSRNQNYSEMPQ